MWKEIIITDLTRMSGDKVCIAGVTPNGKTIRPNLPPPGILESYLYKDGKALIRPGTVLKMNLEPKKHCVPPHNEDHEWLKQELTTWRRVLSSEDWKKVLQDTSSQGVKHIFGNQLHENRHFPPNAGSRSLGTICAKSIDHFVYRVKPRDKDKLDYRLSFTDLSGERFTSIPITDLALRYYVDHLHTKLDFAVISQSLMETFAHRETWLRLGLTRPYPKDDPHPWCYLQVNGIYTFPDYLEGKCFADFK